MIKLGAFVRNLTYSKLLIFPQAAHNLCRFYPKCGVHSYNALRAKMYLEVENYYAYNIMEKRGYAQPLETAVCRSYLSAEEFQAILLDDFSKMTPQDLFTLFKKMGTYCRTSNICLTTRELDDFIDYLTDNIKFASGQELKALFKSLAEWPEPPSIRSRNFIEIWAALDEECLKRLNSYSFDDMLAFIALFFMINVTKYSDFTFKAIQKLASKSKQLSPSQLVQTMFFIGILRKSPYDSYLLELQVENNFDKFTIDDLAIISMGCFKSKTPIRSGELLLKFIDKVIENAKDIHDVSLAALLKIIRYSSKIHNDGNILKLLDILKYQIPRLSVMSCVHIALCGTSTLTLHKECLDKVAEHVAQNLNSARLKDLERLVLTFALLNYKPVEAENFFKGIVEELRKPDREAEIESHGRTFACCLSYLAMLDIYPIDLINKALEPKLLERSYGKAAVLYGREILHLHNLSEIYFKEAIMNKLPAKKASVMAKHLTDYIPDDTYQKQYNITEKMMLDIINALKHWRGNYFLGQHILTHHQRGDFIICNDADGNPRPVDNFSKEFGIIHTPPDSNIWIVLVIAGRNSIIKYDNRVTGPFISKLRDLRALGFKPILVPYNEWIQCNTVEEKIKYLETICHRIQYE